MATILFVDDEPSARQNYSAILRHYGYKVILASGAKEAVTILQTNETIDLLITDMRMGQDSGLDLLRQAKSIRARIEVIVLTGHAEIANAIEAMKLGAQDYLTKDSDYKEMLVVIEKSLEKQTLKNEIERLRSRLESKYSFGKIVGESAAMRQVGDIIRRVAPTESRVLITGESGTGKELVAETLHENSDRKHAPFIAINCGAIPHQLQESELFGYVRGAFTGANTDKKGILDVANRGSVFLDEIGEMTQETQVKLLRFLEDGMLQPVGATSAHKTDVRIIAATNRDLSSAVRDHSFREDLYYRLKVVSIHLPPLRDRKEDIKQLVSVLIEALNPRTHRHVTRIDNRALEALMQYSWPGNIRELRNVIERAMIFTDSDVIEIDHLPEDIFQPIGDAQLDELSIPFDHSSDGSYLASLEEIEKEHIIRALEQSHGNKLLTARHLKIATTTLYRKIRQYGLE